MCGLFCYVGDEERQDINALDVCIKGLERLEYRGYDSSGIAGIIDGKIKACKRVGKIYKLKQALTKENWPLTSAIAHTRWATHGEPTILNTHPHVDHKQSLALVHNGIIENHHKIRKQLISEGIAFKSETDSEVIAQLISYLYDGDIVKTMGKVLSQIEGSLALAVIHVDYPGQIITCARDNPLVVGMDIATGSLYISSDIHAFDKKQLGVLYLKDNEIAIIKKGHIQIFDKDGLPTNKTMQTMAIGHTDSSKKDFEHYMLKEIYDQPSTIKKALEGRLNKTRATAHFDTLPPSLVKSFKNINKIVILGCGSSYHAALIAKYQLGIMAKVDVDVEVASEFRYSPHVLDKKTVVIALSQSGETADTLGAMKKAQSQNLPVIGITNHSQSVMARDADFCIDLRAGSEISVCSTKAFTSQLMSLSLFALMLSCERETLSKKERLNFIKHLEQLEEKSKHILLNSKEIRDLAYKHHLIKDFFFLGRQSMFPAALEGALKLKEITYLSASGYPSGEMKHGPIALVSPTLLTLGLMGHEATYDKMLSNLMEIKSRLGPIVVFTSHVDEELRSITPDIYTLPKTHDCLAPILYALPCQLFAYFMAKKLGRDIDKPRNLAKSVTVE
ncbi:glutamine--fructose-6-phosphate transaminase (isomerizing) [Candidatus Aerophobetes bacterium]|uniref:Glutamine--fructose-6-phosphate aminotransferase [isomerizing] n=1 Tax=Aerophobetes bacterium TaxID=2030807 RepID=A0A2A4X5G9_UNCAE|nr:MAG: glutamine--fructose-6-phosphate transaminase (isomerizing) [Candidatus Aerophobetes bacterium]